MTPPAGRTTPEGAAAIAVRNLAARTFVRSNRTQTTAHVQPRTHREIQLWRTTEGGAAAVLPKTPRRKQAVQPLPTPTCRPHDRSPPLEAIVTTAQATAARGLHAASASAARLQRNPG